MNQQKASGLKKIHSLADWMKVIRKLEIFDLVYAERLPHQNLRHPFSKRNFTSYNLGHWDCGKLRDILKVTAKNSFQQAISPQILSKDPVMRYQSIGFIGAMVFTCSAIFTPCAWGQASPVVNERQDESDQLLTAFNAANADALAGLFLTNGEFIDEEGTVYQGAPEIQALFTAFFEKFPGTTMIKEVESDRLMGPIAIEEGTRITTTKDGNTARIRYIMVRAMTEQGWRIASVRDFADETAPMPNDLLQPLEWLIGDWINEGADARVKITYRWSEDKNFILGDFVVVSNDQVTMKSSQRIGWDPLSGKMRSWTFDSDGGYAEAVWTPVNGTWVLRSSAVNPDGQTGSAIITITAKENGRYVMAGTNRIVGDVLEDDFEITIVKKPPTAGK